MSRRIERARKKNCESLRDETDGQNGQERRSEARRVPVKRAGTENNAHDMRAQNDDESEATSDQRMIWRALEERMRVNSPRFSGADASESAGNAATA